MNIVITGSSGFIGKELMSYIIKLNSKKIAEKKIKLFCIYNSTIPNTKKYIFKKKIDLESKSCNLNFVNRKSIFIHLAWSNLDNFNHKSHLGRHLLFQKQFIDKILKRKPRALFILGSCFEYKIENNLRIKETYKIKPINNYAKAKNKLRQFVKKKVDKNTNFTWGRLFYVWGKGQARRTIFGQFENKKKNKAKSFFLQNPEISLDYLNVKDVAKFIYYLSTNKKSNYETNICSGNRISLGNLVSKWKKIYKLKINIKKNSYKKSLKNNFCGSNDKLIKILNEYNR